MPPRDPGESPGPWGPRDVAGGWVLMALAAACLLGLAILYLAAVASAEGVLS